MFLINKRGFSKERQNIYINGKLWKERKGLNLQISKKKDKLYVSINGEIDHHNSATVRESVDIEIKSGGVRQLIFDFSKLEFMDSSGIGIIMGRYRLMSGIGGGVTVTGASAYIEKILRLSGLEQIIKIQKSA